MKIGDTVKVLDKVLAHQNKFGVKLKELVGQIVPTPDAYKDKEWANKPGIIWVQWQRDFSDTPKWIENKEVEIVPNTPIKYKKGKVKPMAKVVKVRRVKGREIIDSQNGKFFTVIFKSKEDGREIRINGRTNVKKFLKKASGVVETHEDLKTMFNVHKMQYRRVFLDGIQEIRAGGQIYTFE